MKIPIASCLLLTLGACAPPTANFEPGERATARSPSGYTAADYEVGTRDTRLGEVKVWSQGAYDERIAGRERAVIHIGFELEDDASQPMALHTSQLEIDSATLNHTVFHDLRPMSIEGTGQVAAGGASRLDAYFALPPGYKPQSIAAFRVKWSVSGDGITYRQHTPFLESNEDYELGDYYYTPFYDPFYYETYAYYPPVVVHEYPYRQERYRNHREERRERGERW